VYRCGNDPQIGDAVSVDVEIDVTETRVTRGQIALVLETDSIWGGEKNPLLTIKFSNNKIQQIPANWCILCERQ